MFCNFLLYDFEVCVLFAHVIHITSSHDGRVKQAKFKSAVGNLVLKLSFTFILEMKVVFFFLPLVGHDSDENL